MFIFVFTNTIKLQARSTLKQPMMTLQGMADHLMQFQQLEHVVAHIQKNDEKMASKSKQN